MIRKRKQKRQEKLGNETEEKRLRLNKRNRRLQDAYQEQRQTGLLANRQRHALLLTNEIQEQRELRLLDIRGLFFK
ncbi:hypothetical protein TNCV_562811 [Trichonephila clavipes]|nr:hypothetical protein TNCV_562811 [Trichonephila clavipes]